MIDYLRISDIDLNIQLSLNFVHTLSELSIQLFTYHLRACSVTLSPATPHSPPQITMAAKNVTALLSQTLKAHVPASQLPITLKTSIGNLYEILSRTPSAGVGLKVHQTRWGTKEIHDSYWVVSRAQFKREGKNGKAWGRLYWKGA